MYYTTEKWLAHHGIKGQKWGVRRFQNYDGTRIKNFSKGFNPNSIQRISKDYLDMGIRERIKTVELLNPEAGDENCQACTAAFDMLRRTGMIFSIRKDCYDFDTSKATDKWFMEQIYEDFDGFIKANSVNNCDELSKEIVDRFGDDNSICGRINISFATTGEGHAMSFYMDNGQLRIVESQERVDVTPDIFDSYFGSNIDWSDASYIRTDNLALTDGAYDFLDKMTVKD